MPLADVKLSIIRTPLPSDVRAFLRAAEAQVGRIQSECRFPGFVPTDYAEAYHVLRTVAEEGLARGRLFCEWGSGLGIVACLAAMLDFDAFGIEIEGELVEAAQELADDFELPVQFTHGSFIPPGGEAFFRASTAFSWLNTEEGSAHQQIGLDTDDFDVVFSYPWPDEEGLTEKLFDHFAGAGAMLLSYHGGDDFRLRRKSSKRRASYRP